MQRLSRTLPGYLFALMLAIFIAGCGEGPDENVPVHDPTTPTTPTAVSIIDVVARTGPIVAVRVGETAILNGSKSFTSSTQPLSYNWSFASKPDASVTQLLNASAVNPSFVADAWGAYTVQLVVNAEGRSSQRDVQFVVATIDPERLTGPFNHQGLSSNCVNCHNDELGTIPAKSLNHVATSNSCETCHTPLGFAIIPNVDHEEVFGNCSECHNGVLAIGKSEFHVPTVAECDECHNTTSFLELALDGSFDHSGISRSCNGCHNGIVATGKTPSPPDGTHPVTNTDCGFCHTTVSFLGAFPDHTGPDVVGVGITCDSCHGISAIGKTPSPPHPVTTADCAICHNTTNFADAFVDHTGPEVLGAGIRCDSCHDRVIATGKPLNHMPTLDDCNVCHTPGTFASGVYDHAGVVNNCASCHDGVISTGLSANHVPTAADCSLCHTSTITFVGAVFDHTGIVDNCESCHASGIATGKTVDHIPTADDCSVCHVGSTSFPPSIFAHQGITRGCEGCHISRFLPLPSNPAANLVKAANHLPTDQDCYYCHTTTAFIPTIFGHLGISGNCASCHDGSADNIAAGAIGKTNSAIHQNTTGDCSVCHNTTLFLDAFVDHTGPDVVGNRCDSCHNGIDATGKDAKIDHVVTTEDCSICHVPGGTFTPAVFNHTGIVDNCASCHNGTDATGKDAKTNPAHIPTTLDCSVCHTPTVFAAARFDHQGVGVNDSCTLCHDGDIATGKANNHVPTNADCRVCHVTTGFLPATFDHVGIVDNCVSCHGVGFATGKKVDHVFTNQDCGVCHTTRGFIPATFDHTGILNDCSSCHDTGIATGKDTKTNPTHITTSLDCVFCHTTATFVGGIWDHQGITGGCDSCHDGNIAIGKPGIHFDTLQDCNICHSTQGWAPINFTHATPNYPGDHNSTVTCITCHRNNSEAITYSRQDLVPDCAACHANDYEPGPHKWYENPSVKYTVNQLKDCASACHVYTDSSLSTRLKTRNGEHRVSDRNFD